MSVPNPAITVESIRDVWDRTGRTFPVELDLEPVEITDERCVGRMAIAEKHLHPGRLVHGGAWVGFADTVAAWQTMRHLPPDRGFTTVEMKLNAFGAGRLGDELIATAEHLHRGRSTHVVEVRVRRDQRLLANLLVTQLILAAG